MIKKFKSRSMVVINNSHKALYRTPVSCMEYFNAIALTGFALVFFTNYAYIMGLPSYKNFTYMSPAVMWLILVGLGISQFIATTKLSITSTRYSGIILMVSAMVSAQSVTVGGAAIASTDTNVTAFNTWQSNGVVFT